MAQTPIVDTRGKRSRTQSIEVGKSFCSCHAGEELQRYCVTCKIPLCIECIVEQDHKSHNISKLCDVASEIRTNLTNLETKMKSDDLRLVDQRLAQCSQVKDEIGSHSEELIKAINEHAKHITQNVETIRKMFVQKVKKDKEGKEKALESLETQYKNCKSLYETVLKKISDTLEGSRDDEIIEFDSTLSARVLHIRNQIMDLGQPFAHKLQFQKHEAKDDVITVIFGELIEPKIIKTKKVEVVSSFPKMSTDVTRPIGTVAIQRDGKLWFSLFKDNKVQLMNHSGSIQKTVQIDGEINDASLMNNNELLFGCSKGETCLRVVKSNGKVTKFADMKPLFPLGVHVSKTGSILVGLVDEVSYDIKSASKRLVVKLDKSGAVRERYSQDNNYQMMFTAPFRIHENENGDICVVDGTGSTSGRLVILTKAGKLKALYTGSRTLRNVFDPRAVCCTPLSNIIVCDMNNHFLHVLNSSGECLLYLDSVNDLQGPFSIGYNDKDALWVGGFLGDLQCLRYKEE